MQTHLGSGVDLQSTTEYEHITVKSENTTNRTVFGKCTKSSENASSRPGVMLDCLEVGRNGMLLFPTVRPPLN